MLAVSFNKVKVKIKITNKNIRNYQNYQKLTNKKSMIMINKRSLNC